MKRRRVTHGKEIWHTDYYFACTSAYADANYVYFNQGTAYHGIMNCFSKDTGEIQWSKYNGFRYGSYDMVFDDTYIYICGSYLIDSTYWGVKIYDKSMNLITTINIQDANVQFGIDVDNSNIYVTGTDKVYQIDKTTYAVTQISATTSYAIRTDSNNIYVLSSSNLIAISKSTKNILWTYSLKGQMNGFTWCNRIFIYDSTIFITYRVYSNLICYVESLDLSGDLLNSNSSYKIFGNSCVDDKYIYLPCDKRYSSLDPSLVVLDKNTFKEIWTDKGGVDFGFAVAEYGNKIFVSYAEYSDDGITTIRCLSK